MVCAWCACSLCVRDDDDSFEADYSFNNWLAKMLEIAKCKMKQFSQSNFLPILLFIPKAYAMPCQSSLNLEYLYLRRKDFNWK